MKPGQKHARLTPRKNFFFNALLVLFSTTATIIVVEIVLRLFAPVSYQQWMSWIPDGHIRGRGTPYQVFVQRDGYDIRINNLGFRGDDYHWTPAPGVLRIITFGGSSTFNYHAKGEENTWPSRLSHYLENALDMDVEVINLGLPGYALENSKVNYLFLGRALHPHIVVVYHTWNDMKFFRHIDEGDPLAFSAIASGTKPLWQRIARHSQIAIRIRNALHASERAYIESQYTAMETGTKQEDRPPGSKVWAWFDQNFIDFARFAKADQVIPVFVTQATLAQPQNLNNKEYRIRIAVDYQGMTHRKLAETWVQANAHIKSIADSTASVFVDGYSAVPSTREYIEDHVHLTDKGRDRLAHEMATVLLDNDDVQRIAKAIHDAQ